MLVLPNMDPALHSGRSTSIPSNLLRHITRVATRLSIVLAKVVAAAIAMFLIPRAIQIFVQCFDNLQEMLGRCARSPWETESLLGSSAFVAVLALLWWHRVLMSMSHIVVAKDDEEDREKYSGEESKTWERLLIVVRSMLPLLVISFMVLWGSKIVWSYSPRELITVNTVDLEDDKMAGLIWRDRW